MTMKYIALFNPLSRVSPFLSVPRNLNQRETNKFINTTLLGIRFYFGKINSKAFRFTNLKSHRIIDEQKFLRFRLQKFLIECFTKT